MVEESGLRNNYIFALIKFVLFLIIFCFLAEVTKEFWHELRTKENFDIAVLVLSLVSCFGFYAFVADLNGLYKGIQNFFFRSSFFTLVFPSILIVLGLGFFFLPKVLSLNYSRDIFVFVGGFVFTGHLIFIARETKGHTFATVINYLFLFSILYLLNLIFFGIYLKISYPIRIGNVALEGMKQGAALIQTIFTQALR
ncbi:MAG: hypothetical protein K9L86_01545 [Candidatus Omnitrophica bacterium]|nr:hypothetical protein [Candidatus Omnitrophota bacterium]